MQLRVQRFGVAAMPKASDIADLIAVEVTENAAQTAKGPAETTASQYGSVVRMRQWNSYAFDKFIGLHVFFM